MGDPPPAPYTDYDLTPGPAHAPTAKYDLYPGSIPASVHDPFLTIAFSAPAASPAPAPANNLHPTP